MEALAQQLQDALIVEGTAIPVYLGPEHLTDQPELPHAIVVPTGEELSTPEQATRDTLATSAQTVDILCRAMSFEDARALALLCYSALLPLNARKDARIDYGSEVWDRYTVRTARLTVTLPARLTRADVTRVSVLSVLARHHLPPPAAPQEAPDDQTDPQYTGEFIDSGTDPA